MESCVTFRNHVQRARIARTLLKMVRLGGLFEQNGPQADAEFYLRRAERSGLSTGEVIMLRLAFDIWNGDGHVEFGRVFIANRLDLDKERAIAELVLAGQDGSAGLDRWLEKYEQEEPEALSA
jgi:hypothetical protein